MPEQYIQKPGGVKIKLSTTKFKTLQEASDAEGFSPVSAPVAPAPVAPAVSPAPVSPAVDAVKTITPTKVAPAAFALPTGYEKISGAKYPTGEAQKAAYGDIQTDPAGKFLYGKPITPPAVTPTAVTPAAVTPAVDALAIAEDKAPFKIPTGYKKISGAEFPTTETQQAAFEDIKKDPTGEFLYGKPIKTTEEKMTEAEPALERERLGTETPADIENLAYMREKGWISEKAVTEKREGEKTAGQTAITTLQNLGVFKIATTEEIAKTVFESWEYKYYKEQMETRGMFVEAGGESDKAYLEKKYESDKDMLNTRLAAQGLAFSGIRNVAIRGLATELAASELDIDRNIANRLFELDAGFKDTVFDMMTEAIKEAYEGDKDRIEQLNKAGFAVMPDGTLTLTLEAQKEARISRESAEAREDASKTTAIKEYEYALNQGYEKDFEDWITETGGYNFVKATKDQPAGVFQPSTGEFTPLVYGMRTDRHNNPTAFTTDVAKSFGLVEGVDYTKGDPFPNNPDMFTARLIGDGIAVTIKGIDEGGFYTEAGQQRWTHTAMSNEAWHALNYEGKRNVIMDMYKNEGGSGELMIDAYDENYEFSYNEKIDTTKLPDLGGTQITNKTARTGNLPYGITDKQADWIQLRRPGNIEFQKLKSKEFDDLVSLFELRDDLIEIRALKERVNTGWIETRAMRGKRFIGWSEEAINDFSSLEVKTGKELSIYIKSISGAAVSEQEAVRLARNIPNVDMQDRQFIIAINDYEDDIDAIIYGKLAQYDIESEEDLRRIITGMDEKVMEEPTEIITGEDLRSTYNY